MIPSCRGGLRGARRPGSLNFFTGRPRESVEQTLPQLRGDGRAHCLFQEASRLFFHRQAVLRSPKAQPLLGEPSILRMVRLAMHRLLGVIAVTSLYAVIALLSNYSWSEILV